MISEILKSISNREKALLIWLTLLLIVILFNKGIRQSLWEEITLLFAKEIFAKEILFPILALTLNTAFFVFLLYKLNLWDFSLLKDTIFWFVGLGFITLINVNKANDINYFKNFVLDTLKWTIIVEFIINFISFNLWIELIILPIMTMAGRIQVLAERNIKHQAVKKLMEYFIAYFSLFVFCCSLYLTIKQHENFLSIQTLKTFILPMVLSLTLLPFIYLFNLLVKYQSLWKVLKSNIRDKKLRAKVKKRILWIANFNINKVVSITENIAKPILLYNDFSSEMIRTVSEGQYIGNDKK